MASFITPLSFGIISKSRTSTIVTTSPRRVTKNTTTIRRPRCSVKTSTDSINQMIQQQQVLSILEERKLLSDIQFLKQENSLEQQLSHKPTDAELALSLNISVDNVNSKRQAALQARNDLLASHIRMVVRLATRVQCAAGAQPPALHDLVQEGCYALLKAADRFDPSYQIRFCVYAKRAILRACARAVRPAGHVVEVPERLRIAVAQKKKEKLEQGHFQTKKQHRTKSDNENKLIKLAETRLKAGLSLSEVVVRNSDGEVTLMDTLPSPKRLPEQVVQYEMITDQIRKACRRRLKQRNADIIELRFGLSGFPPMTGAALAKKYHVSEPRIAQIILAALEKLRETEPELEQLIYEL